MTRNDPNHPAVARALGGLFATALLLMMAPTADAQLPGLPAQAKPAPSPKADPSKKPIPAKDSPGAVFATTSGPIAVDKKVDDAAIKKTLVELLEQFPGVYTVDVHVRDGAVTLNGHIDDDDSMDDVTAFSEKVEGVRLVLNRMKTDAEILTGQQMAAKVMGQYARLIQKNWLLTILAVGFMIGFGMLARAFARSSETLLAPFVRNSLLRSVVGSILSTVIVGSGVLLGLSILNLTHAVVSVLGLAGVVGLALGFAFKDIAENFIASMLLGVRRPFQIGDFITVAGKSGSVLSLNTRATLLITPEGNHVLIPNSVIYKETLINASATPSTLGAIDLMIPYEASTAEAIEAINEALRATEGLLREPTPRTLVNALEPSGVHLRLTYWLPNAGIDGEKLQSDLRLRIKVALQKLGITSPTTYVPPTAPAPGSASASAIDPGANGQVGTDGTHPAEPLADQAEANLRKDSHAAEAAADAPAAPEASPIDHAIKQAEAIAAAEGNNMLVDARK